MEAPRRGAPGSRTYGRGTAMTTALSLSAVAVVFALAFFLPGSASALESSDNDLVFDDVVPLPSHHVSLPKITLLHPGEVLSPDYQMDSPNGKAKKLVCKMVKKDPPKSTGFFGFFGKKPEPTEEEVCEEVDGSEEEVEEENGGTEVEKSEEEKGEEDKEVVLHRQERGTTAEDDADDEVNARRPDIPPQSSDDEDFMTEDASGDYELPEGSAMPEKKPEPVPEPPKSGARSEGPHFYRIVIRVNEPYHEQLNDRNSPLYKMIAQNITRAVDDLYKSTPGRQSCTVIKIEESPDIFFSTVTLDLGTVGYNDTEAIRKVLERQIREYRSIGDLKVTSEGFLFRDFGAPEASKPHECPEGQIPCRQAGCVSVEARCDGNNDCADGSDELGCPPPATEPPTTLPSLIEAPVTLPTTPKPIILEGEIESEDISEEKEDKEEAQTEKAEEEKKPGLVIPVPTQPPLDHCRADDKVRCLDGSAVICRDQQCDGKRDCADGTDEKDCPTLSPECAHDEFVCDVSRCIHKTQKCDGVDDCSDGTDELNCPGRVTPPTTLAPLPPITTKEPECDEEQFVCYDGRCIEEFRRCDFVSDCPDGEDELHCPCSPEEFTCIGDGKCIDNTKKCDGHQDCADSSDEKACKACPQNQWECQDGNCIDARLRCNKQKDCPDASDEQGCPVSPTSTSPSLICGHGRFRCRDGSCIEDTHRCDKRYDCPDGSDEHSCSIPCPLGDFRCDNGVCIERHRQCDGSSDCNDLSDERNCLAPCTTYEFKCRDGTCIPHAFQCNGQPECPDRSDEENCGPRPTCRSDQFSCNDGTCLSIDQRCNNIHECVTGEDEQGCARCSDSEFRCNDGRCIELRYHCDGYDDCGDNGDEEGCVDLPPHQPILRCLTFQWKCFDNLYCVNEEDVCDGVYNCRDGSDESNEACSINSPGGSLAPCPASDFTCSDGSCLPMSQHCDGITHCPNADDEIDCESCKADEFRCKDGNCIKNSFRCDSIPDCKDKEDEQDCDSVDAHCQPDEIVCDDRRCVKKSKKCDRIFDCIDGLDERDCDVCSPGEFRCSEGTCLDADKRCDGRRDCNDGSDEKDCVTTCGPKDFRCSDGTCININLHCNGHSECRDGSDEINCDSRTCQDGQIQCGNGVCIAESFKCDGFDDCLDSSDELNCPCGTNEFLCPDLRTCVHEDRRCDRKRDCPDGWDESSCPGQCGANEFLCPDRRTCVQEHKRCDRIPDCPDGWDESSCPGHCASNEFHCPDRRTCVPEHKRCDRQRDCPDGWDESNCVYPGHCPGNEFLCPDRRTCVPEYKRCDRVSDCPDGSDESECIYPETCSSNDFTCRDGSCIDSRRRCDRRRDCRDGSDEEGCGEQGNCLPNEFMCGEGLCIDIKHRCDNLYDCRDFSDEQNCLDTSCRQNEFRCGSGECISRHYLCNRRYECADGSDERNCQPTTPAPVRCGPREYLCRANGRCLPQTTQCDGKVDCPDYTDESNCAWKRCDWNEFRCEGGPCIPLSWRCDGKPDCPEKSDELDCSTVPKDGLNLKTYPPDQIIKEIGKDREVVFQCRDEGPARARVKWSRADGVALPAGSRDNNGRLEMPNIHISHTGTYVCEAVGYPENTPGSRVSVYLKVEPFEHPPTRPPSACGLNEATCTNGECIPKNQVCDGRLDCSDGSDEMRCSPHGCEPNEFRCENKKCVLKTWRCDSDDDCGDGSDEKGCISIPGSPCRYDEHQCRSGGQCIPRSFHCDGETDCHDGSDEVGCSLAIIVTPPPPMLMVVEGETFTITCKAVGVPTPEIVWRLNWGHVPEKCTSSSVGGLGTLTCPSAEQRDQGAYSCEAVNVRGGSVFAVPDCILVVKSPPTHCERGFFNALATSRRECIPCFCFGVTSECSSANLFIHQFPPPINVYKIVGAQVEPSGRVVITPSLPSRFGQPEVRPLSVNGFTVYHSEPNERTLLENNVIPYFSMPESYHGNLLKSYGGHLKYKVRSEGRGRYLEAPDVILSGNGYTLIHPGRRITAERTNDVSVRFFYGEWYKRSYVRPGGDISGETTGELASREEIMMTLANVDYLLIRAMYDDGNHLETTISNIVMDTADATNIGLGAATYVEECRCPAGFYGLSCEKCAPRYHRVKTGPWLGSCVREESCEQGYFGDPGRGIACQVCPCPLTSPSNQFGRTCILDSDNQPTCNCPQGYKGRRCETCAEGYEGNPLVPGSSCQRVVDHCNPIGSLSRYPDPRTGQCICKENVMGALCDQCKASAFYLAENNEYGCLLCFCMGITNQCQSSSWYRDKLAASFATSTMGIKLVRKGLGPITQNITEGIHVNPSTREVVFSDFPRGGSSGPEVHYWSLPDQFLGDKVTSYGGYLTFTLRYVPAPGGQSSRNSAPIVEIISWNNLHLLYFGGESVGPDKQETITIHLMEQNWERLDSKPVDRPNFLMALADIKSILIKAAYTTNTREAALHHVSMDIAVDRNTGLERAFPVEHCACPRAYKGLSCEDCAPGYTRDDSGIYLGRCQICQCNGHSDDCDPETGFCHNCRDNTWGDRCQDCRPGYTGDATNRNIGCSIGTIECRCDPRGSIRPDCPSGDQCVCKANVQGRFCDECRQGSFGLSQSLPSGCHECFCSGVSNQCFASTEHYRIQIPMQIGTSGYEFTLTDSTRRETTITEGFIIDISRNEIGYAFPPVGITGRSNRLFWSLPSAFTGNKVTSYGGKITITQRYSARSGSQEYSDTDVIISGNGITLYWKNPAEMVPNQPFTYMVPLLEFEWRHLDQSAPRPASRADLMTVLSNLEAILVRASYSSATEHSYLSDVSMDTAVSGLYARETLATDVEKCYCPPGYEGTSCESCARGYYLDFNDRAVGVFGSCKICPCNGHEESCALQRERNDYVVRCRCLPGYDDSQFCAAVYKESKSIVLSLITYNSKPSIGDIVEFTCSVQERDRPLKLEFTEVQQGQSVFSPSNGRTDSRYGYERKYALQVTADIKALVCTAYDSLGLEVARAVSYITLHSAYESPVTEVVRPLPPVRPPTISISINEPTIQIVEAGGSVRYRCSGRSLKTQIPVRIAWSKEGGFLPPERSQDDGQGLLIITNVQPSDSGTYLCEVTDGESLVTERAVLTVGAPSRAPSLTIYPAGHQEVVEGSPVEFRCEASGTPLPNLQWTKERGGPLNPTAVFQDGIFRIMSVQKSDEAAYVCTGTSPSGTVTERVILYVRESGSPRPSPVSPVRIEPQSFEGNAGENVRLSCTAVHDRRASVRWSRDGGELPASASLTEGGTTLTIYSATDADSGVYICTTVTPAGETVHSQARVTILSYRSPPTVRIEPDRQTISQGTSTELRCLASGDPTPSIRWSKAAQELSSNVQIIGQLLRLNNAQVSDRGVYVCIAQSSGGTSQASAIIEVESVERPRQCARNEYQCSDGTCIPREKYCDRRRDCSDSSDELYCHRRSGEIRFGCRNHEFQCHSGECIAREKLCDQRLDCCDHSDELHCEALWGRQAPSVELYPDPRQIVTRGGSALVQCRVTDGIPAPKLTWTRVDGRPFTSSVEELPGGVLRFNQVTGPEAGQYLCRAENEAGSTSAIAELEMQSLPHISLRYPGSESDRASRQYRVKVGERVRMECSADGDPAPSVTWSRHHPGYPRYGSAAETKESAVYEITRVSAADAGTYKCEARNSLGTTQERLQLIVDSDETANEVDNRYPHGRPYPPDTGVRLNNEKFTVLEGGSVTMRCTVEDNRERIFLTWVRGNQQAMPAEHRIQDGTLFISNVKPDAAGEYICQGIGQSGNTLFTASSHLEVIAPPRIKLNPTRQVVRPGDNAYISCTATGDQPIALTWVRQDGAMPRSVVVSGGSLQFRGIELSDAGRYRCTARNSAGEADAVADVIIDELQQVIRATQRDVSTYVGSSVELRCSPQQGARVMWTKGDNQPLPVGARERTDRSTGETILDFLRVQVEDAGRYFCHAESSQGSSSDFVDLRVEREQRTRCQSHEFQCSSGECIARDKQCDRRSDCLDRSDELYCRHRRGINDISLHIDASPDVARVGDTVDIRCGVSGDPSAVVSWSKVGEQLSPNIQTRGNLLRVNNVTPRNGGVYTCTAQTSAGLYKEDYVLTIQDSSIHSVSAVDGSHVTTQSPIPVETRSVPYGAAVVMECRTDLEPPVTHAWSRQGGLLPKDSVVDMDTLTIPVVQPSDAGIYICTAQNNAVKMDITTVLVVKDVVQRFDQRPISFMSLPTLPSAYLQFSVEISFKPESPDGLILYNGQQPGGAGDFVSFGLSQGHPELRFDVGSGPAIIRSPEPVTLGQWHTVKLDRNRKEGSMYVDGAGPYTGTAAGRFQGLDLEEPLHIGGVPDFSTIHRLAGFSQGFIGCISRLVVGSKEHELVRDATSREGVSSCDTCSSEQALHCRNNGICQEANTPNGFVCMCPSGFSGDHCERVGEACFPGACTTGRCVNDEGGFTCLCPIGRKGARCEEELVVREPAFAADGGYIAYPTPKALKRLKLNLRFKPNEVKNGILLYCAQSEDGKGDFTSLTINDNHVEFRYDVGSGTAILRSRKELKAGQWMTVVAGRDGREGFLSVDGEETVSGKSPGITRGLNLKTPLYVGGYNQQKVKISPGVGLLEDREGHVATFDGCITRVEASGLDLDVIHSVVDSANVAECSEVSGDVDNYDLGTRFGEEDEVNGVDHENDIFLSPKEKNPCDNEPCLNGAFCLPAIHNASDYECHCSVGFRGRHCESSDTLCDSLKPCQNGGTCVSSSPNSYHCLCSLGYGGKNCDQRVEFGESVGFQGDGYLELSSNFLPHKSSSELESIIIEFSTTSSDGIIFWHGQTPETDGQAQDFVAVAVVDGHLEFSYELGSGPALISMSRSRVDDGKRHRVVFHREGKDGSIELDGADVQIGKSPGFLTVLNTLGNIYLGGLPKADYMTGGKYTEGFSGCIHSIDIQNSGPINLYEKALSAVNAHPCSNDKLEDDDDNNNDNELDGLDRAL